MTHHLYNFNNPNPHLQRFKSLRYDPKLSELERILRDINLWEIRKIQKLYKRARLGTDKGRQEALRKLLQIIEDYKLEHMQSKSSVFLPNALEHQIANNYQGIHILDQANDGIPMYVNQDIFLYNTLIIGRVGGGKSSAVFNILKQISVSKLILDPKNIWNLRTESLNAQTILWPYSVSLEIPRTVDIVEGLFSMLEGIASITGLQYGIVPLAEAGKLCIKQLKEYIQLTGKESTICLQDIYHALNLIKLQGIKKDYLASCRAALMLLIGPNNLFVTRKGIPILKILNGNFILPCHRLSTLQCHALIFYLLNFQLINSYETLESTHLKSIMLIDDASSFISKTENSFGSGPKTSYLSHILKKLRGSGRGYIFVDQQVDSIYEDIKGSSANWMIVGGLTNTKLSDVASAMNLTAEQVNYIPQMQPRECIAYFPSHYPKPVHGFIPEVSSISEDSLK